MGVFQVVFATSHYSNTQAVENKIDPTLEAGRVQEFSRRIVDMSASLEDQEEADEPSQQASEPEQVRQVPFYSQFKDVTPASWKKLSCGIASLAMLIDFYGSAISVDTLLEEGIASGAYIKNAGWSHAGLIGLAQKHGLGGRTVGLAHLSMAQAFDQLTQALDEGPVMASVHYTFDPSNPIPHLVVVNGVSDGLVYYNDPAETAGGGTVSVEQFQSAWKKRFIEIRPA